MANASTSSIDFTRARLETETSAPMGIDARMRRARAWTPMAILSLAMLIPLVMNGVKTRRTRDKALERFFANVDANGDGELTVRELGDFARVGVGGEDLDETNEISAAARMTVNKMNRDMKHATVSLKELEAHASARVWNAREVAEWVTRGARLERYAEAFASRGITTLDFPEMIARDGERLRETIGVANDAHREALVRGMKKQLLGFGRAPSAPRRVSARESEDEVSVSWERPKYLGKPPVHEYVVQSGFGVGGRVLKWTDVEVVDDGSLAVVIKGFRKTPGMSHKFRVVAWSEYGKSEGESNWLSDAESNGGAWVSSIISIGFIIRVVASFKNIPRRFMLAAIGFVRFLRARAKGEDVKLRDYVSRELVKPTAPAAVAYEKIDDEHFTPKKVLKKLESVDYDIISPECVSLSDLKKQAMERVTENEFYRGGGGSDGFCQEHPSLRARHYREGPVHSHIDDDDDANTRFCRDLSRTLSNKRCNEPGCSASWKGVRRRGLSVGLSVGDALLNTKKHFCGMCQAWYCVKHTRVSPHGHRGVCLPESRCVCLHDYNMLTKEEQAVLDVDNKFSLETRMQKDAVSKVAATVSGIFARRKAKKAKQSAELIDAFERRAPGQSLRSR